MSNILWNISYKYTVLWLDSLSMFKLGGGVKTAENSPLPSQKYIIF